MTAALEVLPLLRVELAGSALEAADARTLVALRVTQRLSRSALCELRFLEPQGPLGRGQPDPVGLSLRVAPSAGVEPLFAGEVTAVEHSYTPSRGHEVFVRGYDRLHRLRRRQPLRAHDPSALEALVERIVADLGIEVAAEAKGPPLARVLQHGQTDLELLEEWTARCGRYFVLRDKTLDLLDLRGRGPVVALVLGRELLEVACEVNGDPACAQVTAHAWDPSRFRLHSETAASAAVGRTAFAEVPSDFQDAEGRHQVHQACAEAEQALASAQGELDSRAAASVAVRGVADGDPRLVPGARVRIEGVAGPFEGEYVVASATHVLDSDHGYVTEFDTRPPRRPVRRAGATMLPGRVSAVDDPEGLARVKVSLPACGDVETDWLSVLALAAGPGKGLVALPDVGDQVLVLGAQEDPAHGIVLGGLFGGEGPSDPGVADGRVRRFTFMTPGGQKLELDDAGSRVRVQNGRGSYLEMHPDKVTLHAEADLVIEAPSRSLVIAARAIDFRRS